MSNNEATQIHYYLVDKSGSVTVGLGSSAELHPDVPPQIVELFLDGTLTLRWCGVPPSRKTIGAECRLDHSTNATGRLAAH